MVSRTNYIIHSHDDDRSGDYDEHIQEPRHDAVAALARRPRLAKPVDSEDVSAGQHPGRERKERRNTWLNGRHNGYSKRLKFKFTSEEGKMRLENIGVANHNCWPQEPNKVKGQNFTDISPDFVQERRLRERRIDKDDRLEDHDLALKEALFGHPAARGCIPCARLELSCSLLRDGALYPCDCCKKDGHECILFSQPKLKTGCLNCKKTRTCCSYMQSEKSHGDPCEKCRKDGKNCLAGPKNGDMRNGPSYDFSVQNPTVPGSAPVGKDKISGLSKTRGRKRKMVDDGGIVKSSHRKATHGTDPTVTQARKHEDDDHGTTAPLGDGASKLDVLNQGTLNVSNQGTLDATGQDTLGTPNLAKSSSKAGGNKWIRTYFPHPFFFNRTADGEPCKFCSSDVFAMVGYGEVEVLVSYTRPAQPYHQIEGGHSIPGPTFMCIACTSTRVDMTFCKHELIDLESASIAGKHQAEAFLQYLFQEDDPPFDPPFEWCSLCVCPAKVGCCTEQIDGESRIGCGLRLCELCEFDYKEKCGGSMEKLVQMVRVRENGKYWPRADLDFVMRHGHMITRLSAVGFIEPNWEKAWDMRA